jgi:colanic acid biosynthesis glycosyl transferase WcaI
VLFRSLAQVVGRCGRVVPPGDAAALAQAITTLLADPTQCAALGENARDYAMRHLARDAVLGSLVARMNNPSEVCEKTT